MSVLCFRGANLWSFKQLQLDIWSLTSNRQFQSEKRFHQPPMRRWRSPLRRTMLDQSSFYLVCLGVTNFASWRVIASLVVFSLDYCLWLKLDKWFWDQSLQLPCSGHVVSVEGHRGPSGIQSWLLFVIKVRQVVWDQSLQLPWSGHFRRVEGHRGPSGIQFWLRLWLKLDRNFKSG